MVNDNSKKEFKFLKARTIMNIFFAFCAFFIVSHSLLSAPINDSNSESVTIHISSSENLSSITNELKNRNLIRSEFFLKSFVFLFNSDKKIPQGDYLFKRKSSVFKIAWQLSMGKHNINPIKITLREGLTNEEMMNIFADKLPGFRRDLFLEKSLNKQGYLFPDTYFFFPMDTAEEIFNKLYGNFQNQTNKLKEQAILENKNFEDIIKMASLIQGEANGKNDAYIISGILWKRIKIGMPLQVDVDKNTYKVKGLPEAPINNPGLLAIKAALLPDDSSYLYYLHNKEGQVYFAKNFTEHNQNIGKYLK